MVKRSDIVAFMGVTNGSTTTYHRMGNFTEFSQSKNAKEYSRQYVDEDFERTDVVGYAPSIGYSFDYDMSNDVHKIIVDITNNEKMADEAIVSIVLAYVGSETDDAPGDYQREYSVIPDSEGGSTEAYTYSGTLKAVGETTKGKATSTDNWKTCTFKED